MGSSQTGPGTGVGYQVTDNELREPLLAEEMGGERLRFIGM